jgi:hypothetical protein
MRQKRTSARRGIFLACSSASLSELKAATRGEQDRFLLRCSANDPPQILRREELCERYGSGEGAEEAIGLFLILAQGREKLLLLGRGRLECGKLAGQLAKWHRCLVAPSLVQREGFHQWAAFR